MSKFVMIVGTISYRDLDRVRRFVRSLPPETVVITGNEQGVCHAVRDEAVKCGLGVLQFYRLNDSNAEKNRRFDRMIEHADIMVRFHDDLPSNQAAMIMHEKRFIRTLLVNPEFWEQS